MSQNCDTNETGSIKFNGSSKRYTSKSVVSITLNLGKGSIQEMTRNVG